MSIAPDFPASVVQALRQNSACATAFGDTNSTPKIWGVQGFKAVIPFCRILEVSASDTFQSMGADGLICYFERGELQIDVFASNESTARALGALVRAVLNDAPLVFADGALLELRQTAAHFVPEPDPGPGLPAVSHYVLRFLYSIQRNL